MSADSPSRVQRLLALYEQRGLCKPLTYAELIVRAQRLPQLADMYMCAEDPLHQPRRGEPAPPTLAQSRFNQIGTLSQIQICNLFGFAIYQLGKLRDDSRIAPFELQMLLYMYEAKPRHAPLSNLGWSQGNFVIWLYQDLVQRYEIGSPEQARLWLMAMQRPRSEDLLGRLRVGVTRRFTGAFNKRPATFYKWISQNKVSNQTSGLLLAKLLEPDSDTGYTRGQEPDFRRVREDLYGLARFLHKAHEEPDFDEEFPAPELDSFFALPMRRTRKYHEQQAQAGLSADKGKRAPRAKKQQKKDSE